MADRQTSTAEVNDAVDSPRPSVKHDVIGGCSINHPHFVLEVTLSAR